MMMYNGHEYQCITSYLFFVPHGSGNVNPPRMHWIVWRSVLYVNQVSVVSVVHVYVYVYVREHERWM